MEALTIAGKIIHMGETISFGDRFRKCEVVVETASGNKKNPLMELPIEFSNDRIAEAVQYKAGDYVTITCFLGSNKAKQGNRWFLQLRGWKIESAAPKHQGPPDFPNDNDRKSVPPAPKVEDNEEIPF